MQLQAIKCTISCKLESNSMKYLEKKLLQVMIKEKISNSHFHVQLTKLDEFEVGDPDVPTELELLISQPANITSEPPEMICDDQKVTNEENLDVQEKSDEPYDSSVTTENVCTASEEEKHGEEEDVVNVEELDDEYLQVEVVTCVSPSEVYVRTWEQASLQ